MTTQRNLKMALLLALVAVVMVGGTAASWMRTHDLHADARSNVALVDADRTEEVVAAVTKGLEDLLAYDHRDPERTAEVAADFLVGDAVEEYEDQMYGRLAEDGKEQQLVYQSVVTDVGVQRLSATEADLLVLLYQQSARATSGDVYEAPAQIKVHAVMREGKWKVSSIEQL